MPNILSFLTCSITTHIELQLWENWHAIGDHDSNQPLLKFMCCNGIKRHNECEGVFACSCMPELDPNVN